MSDWQNGLCGCFNDCSTCKSKYCYLVPVSPLVLFTFVGVSFRANLVQPSYNDSKLYVFIKVSCVGRRFFCGGVLYRRMCVRGQIPGHVHAVFTLLFIQNVLKACCFFGHNKDKFTDFVQII